MIQPFNITRGGIEYTVNLGLENGESRIYIEKVEPDSEGLRERWYFISLFVEAGNMSTVGVVSYIQTKWKKATLSPAGNVILGTQEDAEMITNQADIVSFIAMFGMPILMSMANGLVRDTWGFNNLPIFDNAGQVKTYTEEQEAEPPTNDYNG